MIDEHRDGQNGFPGDEQVPEEFQEGQTFDPHFGTPARAAVAPPVVDNFTGTGRRLGGRAPTSVTHGHSGSRQKSQKSRAKTIPHKRSFWSRWS